MYRDFYVYTEQIANFEKPFEITKRLIESVNRDLLLGYNFNRYSSEGNDARYHFTIRLNLADVTQQANVLRQLAQLQNEGIIDAYTETNPLVNPSFEDMSINHHLAHEASTRCAFRFYEKKVHNLNRFNEWWSEKIEFLTIFMPRWLKYSGYSFNRVGEVTRSAITCIEELANECGTIVRQVDKNAITDFSIFNERLIHTLLNCISLDYNTEATVCDTVANLQGYDSISSLLQDLTVT